MSAAKKRISILGSTGSIGLNCIDVIQSLPDDTQLIAASAHQNYQTLADQARRFNLKTVVLSDPAHRSDLEALLEGAATLVLAGPEHLTDLATDPDCDILVVATVGTCALPAVLAAVKAGKTLAIANKETLVMAGGLIMPLARKHHATILPIDSEHSAILQALNAGQLHQVEKIIITGSGGPFRSATQEEMAQATVQDALNHPTWNMGPKISIDSATMMNKALEIVEARWLFDLLVDKIEVLIHPESIIHSMVEFCDGSVIAQMSSPDMRLPIQYALTYPDRLCGPAKKLNLHELQELHFEQPDLDRFPAIGLGFEVAARGGTAGAVLNAANEAAVEAFRNHTIPFNAIVELSELCLRKHHWIENPDLDQILDADRWARNEVSTLLQSEKIKQPN